MKIAVLGPGINHKHFYYLYGKSLKYNKKRRFFQSIFTVERDTTIAHATPHFQTGFKGIHVKVVTE